MPRPQNQTKVNAERGLAPSFLLGLLPSFLPSLSPVALLPDSSASVCHLLGHQLSPFSGLESVCPLPQPPEARICLPSWGQMGAVCPHPAEVPGGQRP